MSKQDRQGVRTAADLERKYKFGSFGTGDGGDSTQTSKLSQLLSQFMTATNKKIGEIENALKGIGKPSADDVTYDNTSSSLMATNVRKAIDELDKEIEGFETDIDYSLIEFDTSEIVVESASENVWNEIDKINSDLDWTDYVRLNSNYDFYYSTNQKLGLLKFYGTIPANTSNVSIGTLPQGFYCTNHDAYLPQVTGNTSVCWVIVSAKGNVTLRNTDTNAHGCYGIIG